MTNEIYVQQVVKSLLLKRVASLLIFKIHRFLEMISRTKLNCILNQFLIKGTIESLLLKNSITQNKYHH